MKKLLLALIALSIVATGCGKNNKSGSNSQAQSQTTVGVNQYGVNTTSFISMIDNNQFKSVGTEYQTHKFKTFKYVIPERFSWKNLFLGADIEDTGTQEISSSLNNLPVLDAKKNELKNIINSATSIDSTYYGYYGYIDVYVNYTLYRINFRSHINANPVYVFNRENMTGKQMTSSYSY